MIVPPGGSCAHRWDDTTPGSEPGRPSTDPSWNKHVCFRAFGHADYREDHPEDAVHVCICDATLAPVEALEEM